MSEPMFSDGSRVWLVSTLWNAAKRLTPMEVPLAEVKLVTIGGTSMAT